MSNDTADPVVYLDTSALVKLIDAEQDSDALAKSIASSELLVGEISKTELHRFARRMSREPDALINAAERLVGTCTMLFMDHVLLEEAGDIDHRNLGTLDAIHIATALRAAPIDAFVTYDRQQAAAAESVGLNVVSPG